MEKLLTELFALQRFCENDALQSVIDDVDERLRCETLGNDELRGIAAAGDPAADIDDDEFGGKARDRWL